MLNDFIDSQKKPHAVIFNITVSVNVRKTLNNYIKSIVCADLSEDEKELYSSKIDKSAYADLLVIDGFSSTIKKEDILNIQNVFSYPGIENINKKIYVIYGIENITKQAANSLLKFLEEPPKNTYAIFVTKSPNSILETIKSRCQSFNLFPDKKELEKIIKHNKLTNPKEISIASNYLSLDELSSDLDNGSFTELYSFTNNIINSKDDVKIFKESLETFKKFSYLEIKKILDIISCLFPQNETKTNVLKNDLKFNPNKVLFFNKICSIIQ